MIFPLLVFCTVLQRTPGPSVRDGEFVFLHHRRTDSARDVVGVGVGVALQLLDATSFSPSRPGTANAAPLPAGQCRVRALQRCARC